MKTERFQETKGAGGGDSRKEKKKLLTTPDEQSVINLKSDY